MARPGRSSGADSGKGEVAEAHLIWDRRARPIFPDRSQHNSRRTPHHIGCAAGYTATMARKASVVIEKDEHGFYAWCPELTGRRYAWVAGSWAVPPRSRAVWAPESWKARRGAPGVRESRGERP